ncbi:Uncharacterized protein At4g02000 [Linum perenne]
MAGAGTQKISFGQFAAIDPTAPLPVERLPESVPIGGSAAAQGDVDPSIDVVQAVVLEGPAADELPAVTDTDAGTTVLHDINTQTDEVPVATPDVLVPDEVPGVAAHDVPEAAVHEEVPEIFHDEEDPAVHFTEEDLVEARERAELSLLARIFWEEPRELRAVENSFIQVWKCGRVRIFDVGSGLYQFIFPSISKRNWVLENQPWFFQRSIIHFSDIMMPSEELFHSLQYMQIWVKIIGLPLAFLTIAVGRKLLAKLGEVVKVGYYDAGTPEGCYIKGRVRMNLLGSFLGTAPVTGVNGSSFPAFFQYIGVPCICYLCGWLGHVMADCPRTDLAFDEDVRSDWICGQADKNEKESQGPQLQSLPFVPQPHVRRRGGLPPSVAARLSSTLQRQWAQDRQRGGVRGQFGHGAGGPRPVLALPGPGPILNLGPGQNPLGSGPPRMRPPFVRPLQILAPRSSSANGSQGRLGSVHADGIQAQTQTQSAASCAPSRRVAGRQLSPSSLQPPPAQRAPMNAQQAQRQRREELSGGPAGLIRALSASGSSQRPEDVLAAQQLISRSGPQFTPQSKPLIVPGPSRRSTPSSGSAKRKLLADFEIADGPPAPKSA